MSDKKNDDNIIKDIDEAEATAYKQIFGVFDNNKGDFISVKFNDTDKDIDLIDESIWISDEDKRDNDELDDFTYELMTAIVGEKNMVIEKESRELEAKSNEINKIITLLSEKEISSMVISIKIDGIIKEYVNDEKAGEKYLSKDAQIEKIKEVINGFKNIVIVYSEEELKKLQEDFIKNQEKKVALENRSADKSKSNKESLNEKIKTQVYIRITEKDYEVVKDIIEKENIKISANKVKTRDDKRGINMVIQAVDADKVRNILSRNDISILQDVDGNIDWSDIKERSNKFENVTVDQLREFQSKNNDKFDYIAFRKDDIYTIFADKKCDIAIGISGRKTLKQLEEKVEEHKKTNLAKKDVESKVKTNNSKEAVR